MYAENKVVYWKESNRKYAIVEISSGLGKKVCYILEFAGPDNRSISTLIFAILQGTNLERVISHLIHNALLPIGSWKIDGIERFKQFNCLLAKHCEDTPKEWVARLSKKVVYLWEQH